MSRQIIFGTTNQAKVERAKRILAQFDVEIIGLDDSLNLPGPEENGKTVLENARTKATHYSKLLKKEVLSMDSALCFNDLPEKDQPKTFVRKLNSDHRLTDREMVEEYAKLFNKYDHQVTGYWETAWVLSNGEKIIDEVVTKSSERIYAKKPSKIINKEMPLNSLQIDPETGKYFSEMNSEEHDKIWDRTSGKALARLFKP